VEPVVVVVVKRPDTLKRRGVVVQRQLNGETDQPRPAPHVDIDELVERVYRRFQDELRREREREHGIW
jgi:hypothetical protein